MIRQSYTRTGSNALSSREGAVLAYLRRAVSETYCPSFEEIADAAALASKSQVHAAIQGLKAKGYVKTDPRARRSIELTDPLAGRSTSDLLAMRQRIDTILGGRAS